MHMPTAGARENVTVAHAAERIDSTVPRMEAARASGAGVVAVRVPGLALPYADRHTIDAIVVDLRGASWWLTPEIRALLALTHAPLYAITAPGDAIPHPTRGWPAISRSPYERKRW